LTHSPSSLRAKGVSGFPSSTPKLAFGKDHNLGARDVVLFQRFADDPFRDAIGIRIGLGHVQEALVSTPESQRPPYLRVIFIQCPMYLSRACRRTQSAAATRLRSGPILAICCCHTTWLLG
jgi:hypothetical protein